MTWLVFAVACFAFVVVLPLVEARRERRPDRRRKFLKSTLNQTQLVIDTETWANLDRYAARRARWGAGGRGVGMAIGIAVSLWLMLRGARDAFTVLPGATSLVGHAVGAALSGQRQLALSPEQERVSALQPQDLREYPRSRVLATEVGCGVLGVLAAVLQLRLLRLPVQAVGQAQLVEHDVRLALSLRDLAWVVTFTTVLSAYAILTSIGAPILISVVLLAAFSLLVRRPFHRKLRPEHTPVATRLVGRSRPA